MKFYLVHDEARSRATAAVQAAPHGHTVEVKGPAKNRDQECKYHSQIADIAAQYEFCNRKWDAEDMKRLLIDQFKRDTINDPEICDLWAQMGSVNLAPSLDGSGVVALGIQSRKFPKKLATLFIEWMDAFGAQVGVKFSEPKRREAA